MTTRYRIDLAKLDDIDPGQELPLRLLYGNAIRLHHDRDEAERVAARLNENEFGGLYVVVEVPEASLGPDDRRLFRRKP